MPTEPIQCPNCSSGSVRQLAGESYRCNHCGSPFKCLDPSRITVTHEPTICYCNRFAVALCYRCKSPLCKRHKRIWGEVGRIEYLDHDELNNLSDIDGFDFEEDDFRRAIIEQGLPDPTAHVILCGKCNLECYALAERILDDIGNNVGRSAPEQPTAVHEPGNVDRRRSATQKTALVGLMKKSAKPLLILGALVLGWVGSGLTGVFVVGIAYGAWLAAREIWNTTGE
jgi:hypothetical protein